MDVRDTGKPSKLRCYSLPCLAIGGDTDRIRCRDTVIKARDKPGIPAPNDTVYLCRLRKCQRDGAASLRRRNPAVGVPKASIVDMTGLVLCKANQCGIRNDFDAIHRKRNVHVIGENLQLINTGFLAIVCRHHFEAHTRNVPRRK